MNEKSAYDFWGNEQGNELPIFYPERLKETICLNKFWNIDKFKKLL